MGRFVTDSNNLDPKAVELSMSIKVTENCMGGISFHFLNTAEVMNELLFVFCSYF